MKHLFLFAFLIGLASTTFLFAYSDGPLPASNGVFGGASCNQNGCHTGNPLNASGGSLTLTGLPPSWSPGQTYLLTVTVQRANAAKYGFQLTAVSDATDVQAGSFSVPAGQSQVSISPCFVGTVLQIVPCSTPGSLRYAQHNLIATSVPPYTGVFSVNWTAPSSVAGGAVRFDLAGNAANGNAQNSGDFIYERRDVVPAGPPSSVSAPFALTNLQSSTRTTAGTGVSPTIGYSRIQANAGSTTPSGVAVFSLRQNNVLVSEAGVPASPLMTMGRLYVEVSGVQRSAGAANTGIAIANPNSQPATINISFTDSAGIETARGPITVPANRQLASFVDQAPFSSGPDIRGTLSFTSSVPVGVIALRGYYNERPGGSEFLITTLPVVDTADAPTSTPVVLPHFADGGGWITQIVLINPTDNVLTGTIQLFSPGSSTTAGSPIGPSSNYVIPRRGSFKAVTQGMGAAATSGSVRITPSGQTNSPSAIAIFTFRQNGVTVSEAGVAGVQGNAFRLFAEVSGLGDTPGTVQTGIAVTNMGTAASSVFLELFKLDGTPLGLSTAKVDLGPNGQSAQFLSQVFPSLPLPFQGIVRISTTATSGVSVVGLRGRYNERPGDFLVTTTPASNEVSPTSSEERVFPHLVDGGGYTTQFILFSGTGGQVSNGQLRFFIQDGSPLELTMKP